ncbi:MAG: hypothetical protein E4H14_07685 [Candidatus Thorarchaeota archaeon]|nr:MAG: hypothetical protein E4H14_07685 [Candidatus Thorarchaeota archaeon]
MGKVREFLHFNLETKARIIAVIMAAVALFTPYMFYQYFDPFDGIYVIWMMSLTWIHYSNVIPFFIFPPFQLLNNPINTLLRFWFVFEMYRCYIRKSTLRRALYIGVIGELWQFSIMIFQLFLGLLFGVIQISSVPIPLLLIVGVIILKVVKPPKLPELWNEKSDEDDSTDDFLSG